MSKLVSWLILGLMFSASAALAADEGPAPPPATGVVYVVGYVEAISSGVPVALTALREYRDAISKEPKNLGARIYREEGQPNRFMLTETWGDQAAYDAHLKAASTTQLIGKLRPIQGAPPDIRVHRGFSVGAPPAPNPAAAAPPANTVYVMSHLDVAPPLFAQLIPNLRPYVDAARKERGVVRFDILQMVAPRQNHLTVMEAWSGTTPQDAHRTALTTRTFRDRLHPLLGALYDERIYRVVN